MAPVDLNPGSLPRTLPAPGIHDGGGTKPAPAHRTRPAQNAGDHEPVPGFKNSLGGDRRVPKKYQEGGAEIIIGQRNPCFRVCDG